MLVDPSITKLKSPDESEVFPKLSMAYAVTECAPAVSDHVEKDQSPELSTKLVPIELPPSNNSIVDPTSAVPERIGIKSLVPPIVGFPGAVVSIFPPFIAVEATLVFPDASVSLAVNDRLSVPSHSPDFGPAR